jgi:Ca-activated chloride channel family protein
MGCAQENEPKKSQGISEPTNSESGSQQEDTNRVDKDPNKDISEKQGEEDIQAEKEIQSLEDIPSVPKNTEGFIKQTAGSYTNVQSRTDNQYEQLIKELDKLDPLPEDATDKQVDAYFNYLYSLVAEDFPDPEDIIKKWEFGTSGGPDVPDPRYEFKENYNVEVLLDASGSMGAYIGDKTMMEIAKESIHDFMKQVPEDANVSFRVYGHKGTGSNEDKEMSCNAIEQVYGYAPYDEKRFQKELDKIEPAGWTPLADVLKQAEEALQEYDAENSTNLIYVVSDGVETCDGDPVEVAKSLSDSNAEPIINIIGFNVNSNAQKQLKKMASVSGGVFATANNQEQLEEEFNRAEEVLKQWETWKKDALGDADAKKVDNNFDILSFQNEWGSKTIRQENTISTFIQWFQDEGVINKDQRKLFESKKKDIRVAIDDSKEELKNDLKDISTKGIEELKNSINEKYNKSAKDES